jgi:group I intron endonuclease
MAWIYILESPNKKFYVGQTVQKSIYKRITRHKNDKLPIGNAIRKYGLDNFNIYKFECDEEDLDYFERGFIKTHNSLVPNGYNLETGGNKNKHMHPDTISKMSYAHIGKPGRKWTNIEKNELRLKRIGKNNPRYGVIVSSETKKRLSESHMGEKATWFGKKLSKEHCKKLSESHLGQKSWNKGKHLSPEHIKHFSESRKGKCVGSDNWKARKVKCIETNEIFMTITDAKKKYHASHIVGCCMGNRKTSGGYHWKYFN